MTVAAAQLCGIRHRPRLSLGEAPAAEHRYHGRRVVMAAAGIRSIVLLVTIAACRAANPPTPASLPPYIVVAPTPAEAPSAAETPEPPAPETPALVPPSRPSNCTRYGRPSRVVGSPRIDGVADKDAQAIIALAAQYTEEPLFVIRRRRGPVERQGPGTVEAFTECCIADCTLHILRFDKEGGIWQVVLSTHLGE